MPTTQSMDDPYQALRKALAAGREAIQAGDAAREETASLRAERALDTIIDRVAKRLVRRRVECGDPAGWITPAVEEAQEGVNAAAARCFSDPTPEATEELREAVGKYEKTASAAIRKASRVAH